MNKPKFTTPFGKQPTKPSFLGGAQKKELSEPDFNGGDCQQGRRRSKSPSSIVGTPGIIVGELSSRDGAGCP